MDYIKGRRNNGGMIMGIGVSEQDCASIKYMFEYLENGLREISFESANDFCIVLDNGKRLYFQVKINQFTLKKVSELLRIGNIKEKTVFIGSGCDDRFRNLLQDKERYIQARDGILCEDKQALLKEMTKICQKSGMDTDLFLQCDFMSLESMGREAIAKSAIEGWARNKNIYIDVDSLYNELMALISNRFRTIGGYLSKKEIVEIIKKHRTSKIESFIPKRKRFSSVIEEVTKRDISEYMDCLIIKYSYLKDKLYVIKLYLQNDQLVEAKNSIESILNMCHELESIFLMILNLLGEYDLVIERENMHRKESDCIVEYAKAHMYKSEFIESQKCMELINKSEWDYVALYISAVNHQGLGDVKKAREELEKCIELNDSFVDAYTFLASLIYISEPSLATEYLDAALNLEPKYAKAYMLRAQISQLFDDFVSVIENCEKYITYSRDDENESILLMLATNKFHIGAEGWQSAFQKWNEVFRKKQNIVGEVKFPLIDWGREYLYPFVLQSMENGLTVFLGEQEIFSYRKDNNMARTAIGLFIPQIDANMYQFVLQDEKNPIRKSSKSIFDEVALPTIYKFYEDYESYEHTLKNLLEQSVLHLNHIFRDDIKEYVIRPEDIKVEMKVIGKKLVGDAIIGQIDMRIDINPLTNSLDRFCDQLYEDCGWNEAAIILVYDEQHQTQLTFPKKKMKLTIIDEI
ncbi:MAG: hypothetical protein UFG06_10750 [Lachnospiraceae bacterium]|nr:hypothetical protein [Lachnospiraceae bacterium]